MDAINKENFKQLFSLVAGKSNVNFDYAYDVYCLTIEAMNQVKESQSNIRLGNVNPIEIVLYIIGEYLYNTYNKNADELANFLKDDMVKEQMAAVVADKYLSLSMYNYKETKFVDKYFPPISSLNLYVNFMMNIVNSYEKNSPETTLVADTLNKSLSITRCIINLLNEGYYTEAFASWRTLHECECTLILLDKYPAAINAYLKHMQYALAYKDALSDKKKQDDIFVQIKEEMKALDLKSKDMKKYIEYGWLTAVPEFMALEVKKFNFRDGLELVSGLTGYSERYMMSSEILHSTPLLIYSNQQYFYFMTLLSTYESFFRLEKLFGNFIAKRVTPELLKQYDDLRNVYYAQLINIHKRETLTFMAWQKHNEKKAKEK